MVERSPSNYKHKKSVLPKKARTFFVSQGISLSYQQTPLESYQTAYGTV